MITALSRCRQMCCFLNGVCCGCCGGLTSETSTFTNNATEQNMTLPEALKTLGRVNLQKKAFHAIVNHLQSNQDHLGAEEQKVLDACHVVLVHIKAKPAIASGVPFDGRKS